MSKVIGIRPGCKPCEPNPHLIERLQEMLAEAQAGTLHSAACVYQRSDDGIITWIELAPTCNSHEFAQGVSALWFRHQHKLLIESKDEDE